MKLLILLAIVGAGVLGCQNIANCGQCSDSTKTCEACWGSYFNNGQCVVPTATKSNCLTYSNKDTCKECVQGYYLDQQKTCTAIKIEKCLAQEIDNKCAACEGVLSNEAGCKGEPCNLDNCKACEAQDKCRICKQGFTLDGNKRCVQSQGQLTNCTVAASGSTCNKCQPNFRINNGACTKEKSSKIASVFALVAGILGMVLLSA